MQSVITLNQQMLLISVAFNKPFLIEQQIRLVSKNYKDPHRLVIADNSSEPQARVAIQGICKRSKIGYYPLPSSSETGSRSHGIALNWSYENIVKKRNERFFGFLDHDVLAIKPSKIMDRLGPYGMMGLLQPRKTCWYLWPGYCFFDRKIIGHNRHLNFMPVPELDADTGAGNWPILYCDIKYDELSKLDLGSLVLRDKMNVPQLDACSLFGPKDEGQTWIHTINGSCWYPDEAGSVPKENLIKKYLEGL